LSRGPGTEARHPDFGDCFTNVLAKAKRELLLLKGADLVYTDIEAAICLSVCWSAPDHRRRG
jgi:uncharacterized protein with PIN domain